MAQRTSEVCLPKSTLLLNLPDKFEDTTDMEENMYDLASTAHMHYQLDRQCRSPVDPLSATEKFTCIDLTGDDDANHWNLVYGDYQELVPSSVPDDVDGCHQETLRERSASVPHGPIESARQHVNDAAVLPSERKSHDIRAHSLLKYLRWFCNRLWRQPTS